MKKISLILVLVLLFSACKNNTGEKNDKSNAEQTEEVDTVKNKERKVDEVTFKNETEFAEYMVRHLRNIEVDSLEKLTADSLVFSPYAHIDRDHVQKLSLEELKKNKKEELFWGFQDGSGDSIIANVENYMDRYVYDFDIFEKNVETTVYEEKPKRYGNELHNVQEIFPESSYVEFYKPADDEVGMNWKALILVIDKNKEKYTLQAILHNQWTI